MPMVNILVTQLAPDPTNPTQWTMQTLLKQVMSDDTPEARQVQDALGQLQTDRKSGTATPEQLQQGRQALQEAMRAYRRSKVGAAPQADDAEAAGEVKRLRPKPPPAVEAPNSEQAQADFRSLATALAPFQPAERKTGRLEQAKTGRLVDSQA